MGRMESMEYILMHETITNHDAIGNDIEAMYHILNRTGRCYVYAVNQFNDSVRYISKDKLETLVKKPDAILIYHHSVYWEYGYDLLKNALCKKIIRYHNITPAHFFAQYNDWHHKQCLKGRELTKEMIRNLKDVFWLCDSGYNASEVDLPEQYIGICPPFHKIESWAKTKPNEAVLRELADSETINILFVGRIVPNKGYEQALDILHFYCSCYDQKIKFRVIGKFDDGLAGYNQEIREMISDYNLEENVEFIGETSDADLLSYYLGSDLLLCCSRHEGFCIPIIEAQYFGLPVIALSETAVPETIGKNQLCLKDDNRLFTAAIRTVSRTPKYAAYLRREGLENYQKRFSYSVICDRFRKELERGCRTE